MATDTDTETKASAAQRVFGITELAEKVFLELPMQNILVNVTRVSKHWKAVVDGSLSLQQGLFLKPLPGPLIESHVPYAKTRFTVKTPEGPRRIKEVFNNPLIFRLLRYVEEFCLGMEDIEDIKQMTGSWKSMLAFQPPVRNVYFERHSHFPPFPSVVTRGKGIHMSDMEDRALPWAASGHDSEPMQLKWTTEPRSAREVAQTQHPDFGDGEDESQEGDESHESEGTEENEGIAGDDDGSEEPYDDYDDGESGEDEE